MWELVIKKFSAYYTVRTPLVQILSQEFVALSESKISKKATKVKLYLYNKNRTK